MRDIHANIFKSPFNHDQYIYIYRIVLSYYTGFSDFNYSIIWTEILDESEVIISYLNNNLTKTLH